MLKKTFPEVAKELELAAARLAEAHDPDFRREVLLHMRFLLMEADTMLCDRPKRGLRTPLHSSHLGVDCSATLTLGLKGRDRSALEDLPPFSDSPRSESPVCNAVLGPSCNLPVQA